MQERIWMLPILFIVHDMEEIMGLGLWLKKNRSLLDEKYPRISNTYREYSTEGMTAAVMEEMFLCLLICSIARVTGFYGLWLGTFVAYALHLMVHIGQSIIVRKYIPAVITSILCLPFCLWFLTDSIRTLSYSAVWVLIWSLAGVAIVAGNLKIAHGIIHIFTKRVVKNGGTL